MLKVASRVPDWDAEPERFGWNSSTVKRALSKHLGAPIVGDITKAAPADTSAGSIGTLIQQGVEPVIYEDFIRNFPLYDLYEKEESNGLVHAWDKQTAYSQSGADAPVTMAENDSTTDDANTYAQDTTKIAIYGTRRGASLMSLFAAKQGTGNFGDLSERETEGGLIKIAHDVQAGMLRFQNVDNTANVNTNAKGLYNAKGVNGFRYHCDVVADASFTIDVDTTGAYDPSKQTVLKALGQAADVITDALGMPVDHVVAPVKGRRLLINEQLQLVRHTDKADIRPGLSLDTVELGSGAVPIYPIPGDAVGTYTILGTGDLYYDLYVGISGYVSIPWLGGPTPTVLNIPVGSDGKLRKLTIPFVMLGLAFHSNLAIARVRVKIA